MRKLFDDPPMAIARDMSLAANERQSTLWKYGSLKK